jgi:tetratricopeptide (TPR) repeat protein
MIKCRWGTCLSLLGALLLAFASVAAQTNPSSLATPVDYYRGLMQARDLMAQSQFAKAADLYEGLVNYYKDDVESWQGLGDSRFNLKQYRAAATAYQKGLSLKTGDLSFDYYRIAQAYALAEEARAAIEWLEKAIAAGYERRSEIAQDPAFALLHNNPRLSELAGALPKRSFSREEGWRYDLSYLVAEIKRLHYLYRAQPLPSGFAEAVKDLRENIARLTDEQIIVRLQGLMARLGDGHSVMFFFAGEHALKRLPIRLHLFSDGLFIVSAADDYKKWLGSRVVKIGETGATEALWKLAPYVSRESPKFVEAIGPMVYLTSPAFLQAAGISPSATEVSLTLATREGRTETLVMPARPATRLVKYLTPSELPGAPPAPSYMLQQSDNYWYEVPANSKTLVLHFNLMVDKPDESLRAFSLRLRRLLDEQQIQNLIVDARNNYGGNQRLMWPLIRTLIHFETTRPNPGLFVITSRTTFSATQPFISQVNRVTNAVFVGEPSGSSPNFVGEDTELTLPYSGLFGSISSRYNQSDELDRRLWIAPQIPTALSSQDYFANRDPSMAAILQIIRDKN